MVRAFLFILILSLHTSLHNFSLSLSPGQFVSPGKCVTATIVLSYLFSLVTSHYIELEVTSNSTLNVK